MLRPFLLVGVGGSGGKTLRVVREDLERRLQQAGWVGDLPRAWQFLHIDVPTVADGNDPDLPAQLPDRDYQGLVASGVDYRTIDAAMTSTASAHLADALGGWRPDPNRVNIPASKGAGQYRALGRVITVAGLDRVREALQHARRQLTGAEVIGELQQVTTALGGVPSSVVHEPTVVVVSSIAGGSGSGAVIDVCDAVRALGDKWASEIVGILYAPDVFDYLPEEARRGVRPNSLAALAELLSGFWNEDGATEGTTDLFARYGVQLGTAKRLGPRYPFLVGARNEHVTYRTQNDIYRALGRSLGAWVVSERLQDSLSTYTQGNWAPTAQSVPDKLGLHTQGTETPFAALGSSRVGLGRDRFRDYASEHLARTVVERFTRRHEELRQRGDDRTEKQLVRDTADDVFGGFLAASGLDERGKDRNQIVDALRPQSLRDDLKAVFVEIQTKAKEAIPDKGARAEDVRRNIRNLVKDRQSHFQTAQLAARTDAARSWVDNIQRDLTALTARYIASSGAPVTVELLRRLSTEVGQVRDELRSEASASRRWAADVDQQIRGALDDADTAVILRTTDRLAEAVKRAVQTFAEEQEAEIRDLAVELIQDLVDNVLEPLVQSVEHGLEALAEAGSIRGDGRPSVIALWPEGDVIPIRLRPAPNEFLLEKPDDYPSILSSLVSRTIGIEQPREARKSADIQVLLGTDEVEGRVQHLVVRTADWVPRNHLLHRTVTAAPSRASFVVHATAGDLLDRARGWLHRDGTAVGRYMDEGLRDYLDPASVGPADLAARLQRFEGQLIAALNAGSPLVSVNPSVLVQVHGKNEVSYTTLFSEVPLPEKSPARERFRTLLESRSQWNEVVEKSFSDGNGAFIDIFTVNREPYEPVVFDSLMRPIASEWGARSASTDQRAEFWRWRRSRPLSEALPFSPAVLRSLVRGWFVAGCLGHLDVSDTGARVFVPADLGKGGRMAAFPWPTLTSVKPTGPDLLPALLESVTLAMLDVNTTESLDPMKPYERLRALGSSGDDVPDELSAWILDGRNPNGDTGPAADWELRRKKVEQRIDALSAKFDEHFSRVEEGNDLLGFPGSYELRGEIRASLGDLRRSVGNLQPVADGGGFY